MNLRFESQPRPKFRYSPAVRMGPFVKTAGMVGLSPVTGELVSGGVAAEFAQIIDNLSALMDENALRDAPMSATIFTTAFHRFAEINAIWDEHFADASPLPARSAIGVSQLPIGAQVEADFLFYDATWERRA
ncbi:MAG: RidA family protein [Hyphomicrobiales bacterium]